MARELAWFPVDRLIPCFIKWWWIDDRVIVTSLNLLQLTHTHDTNSNTTSSTTRSRPSSNSSSSSSSSRRRAGAEAVTAAGLATRTAITTARAGGIRPTTMPRYGKRWLFPVPNPRPRRHQAYHSTRSLAWPPLSTNRSTTPTTRATAAAGAAAAAAAAAARPRPRGASTTSMPRRRTGSRATARATASTGRQARRRARRRWARRWTWTR
jgi:hypothetical protein